MKFVHVLSYIFAGLWFLLTGFFALAGVVVTPVFVTILNILALLAGIFFLVSVAKACCCHDKCCCSDKCSCGCKGDKCDVKKE